MGHGKNWTVASTLDPFNSQQTGQVRQSNREERWVVKFHIITTNAVNTKTSTTIYTDNLREPKIPLTSPFSNYTKWQPTQSTGHSYPSATDKLHGSNLMMFPSLHPPVRELGEQSRGNAPCCVNPRLEIKLHALILAESDLEQVTWFPGGLILLSVKWGMLTNERSIICLRA